MTFGPEETGPIISTPLPEIPARQPQGLLLPSQDPGLE